MDITEHLIDSLNSQLYDTSNANRNPDFGYDAQCICVKVSDTLSFGRYRSYKTFVTNYSLNQSIHTLVEGIGMMKYQYSFDIGHTLYNFSYAIIGNTVYYITSLNQQESTLGQKRIYKNTFDLYKTYPNPFNSQVTVVFETFKQTKLQISIYNILGEKIKNILFEKLIPGMHEFPINFRSESSGIYIIRLDNYKESKTVRVVYLK